MTDTDMDPTTLKALKASIAHWHRHATGTARRSEHIWYTDCALCSICIGRQCNGCPVKGHTGYRGCVGSPYNAAEVAYNEEKSNAAQSKKFRTAARRERDFLIDLLPEKAARAARIKYGSKPAKSTK